MHGLGAPPYTIHLHARAQSRWGLERGPGLPLPARDDKRAWMEEVPGTTFGVFPSWVRREILRAAQQLSEAGGRRPRLVVDSASQAKRARTAIALAAAHADDSYDE